MKLKRGIILVTVLLFLMTFGLLLWTVWYSQGPATLKHFWKVEKIIIDSKDVTSEFRIRDLTFYDDHRMLLPKHYNYMGKPPLRYSKWDFKWSSFFTGYVVIDDTEQDIFDGRYNIDFISYQVPELVVLYSDSIQITLRGRGAFSLDNQTIKMNWPTNDTIQ